MSSSEKINRIDQKFIRKDLPRIDVGDNIKMRVKVSEGGKVRLHPFEGTIIRKTGSGMRATFTVRKISFGEGVERTFPLHSPVVESIEVISKGVIKRAKLYYLRERMGKQARVKKQLQEEAPVSS